MSETSARRSAKAMNGPVTIATPVNTVSKIQPKSRSRFFIRISSALQSRNRRRP